MRIALAVLLFGFYFSASASDIKIEWCRSAEESLNAIIDYEIWHSTDLVNWELLTITSDTFFQKPADLPQEFFKVRARYPDTGEVSDWATADGPGC